MSLSYSGNKYDTKCFYYGKIGHLSKFCFKRQTDEARNKQRKHTGHFTDEYHSHDIRLFVADYSLRDLPGRAGKSLTVTAVMPFFQSSALCLSGHAGLDTTDQDKLAPSPA